MVYKLIAATFFCSLAMNVCAQDVQKEELYNQLLQAHRIIADSYKPDALKNNEQLEEELLALADIYFCLRAGRISEELFNKHNCAKKIAAYVENTVKKELTAEQQ